MSVNWSGLAAIFVLIAGPVGSAMPQQSYQTQRQAPPPREDPNSLIRQIKIGLADLKNEVGNHEAEIRTFEEKLQNQEISHEQLRQQLTDDVQSQKDYLKASTINLDGKIETLEKSVNSLETVVNGLTTDLRQIKTQANESVAVLGQYREKISELEKLLGSQSQQMQNLEAALQSIIEMFQAKHSAKNQSVKISDSGEKTYKVQPGDTLEKIARAQKVTVQALREANQLTGDRIIVGQTLKIP